MRALRTEKNRAEHKTFSAVNWIWGVAMAALMVALIFTVWFTGIRITDPGMSPTLYPGDVVLFDKLSMHLSMPKRGEAYAFRGDAGTEIGRIVALPGDRVAMKEGKVYISGYLLDESAYKPTGSWDMEEITLKQGEFFIMPDDRENGLPDAAAMRVKQEQLIGRAARDNFLAERNEIADEITQSQGFRPSAVQRQHVAAERGLQRREAEQLVQHDIRRGIALQLDHDANPDAVGFVCNV